MATNCRALDPRQHAAYNTLPLWDYDVLRKVFDRAILRDTTAYHDRRAIDTALAH